MLSSGLFVACMQNRCQIAKRIEEKGILLKIVRKTT